MLGAMTTRRRVGTFPQPDQRLPAVKQSKPVPHAFVLEAMGALKLETRRMFGSLAVYVGNKIVLILRDRPGDPADNGVWIATTEEHHLRLRRELPKMGSIRLF